MSSPPADAKLIGEPDKVEVDKQRPFRQRSGKPGKGNLKPYLLVDEARYVLGVPERGKESEARLLHAGFLVLLRQCLRSTREPDLKVIAQYLIKRGAKDANGVGPADVVMFNVDRGIPTLYPFERPAVQKFWVDHVQQEFLSEFEGQCASCNKLSRLLQTLPFEVVVLGQKCQITSLNKDAFTHFGKQQTLNAPLCFSCGSQTAEALSYLLDSDAHHVVLTRENRKRGARNPLRNQVAVFWLARPEKALVGEIEIDLETELTTCLDDVLPESESHLSQMEHFLRAPETGREAGLQIADNAFYLAVLSANKARLVVREWIDASLAELRRNLKRWFDAQRICGPNGGAPAVFAIRRVIRSLYRDEDDSDADPNLVRTLLRTAFKGSPPPPGLLQVATARFGKVVLQVQRPELKRGRRESLLRQLHVLAACIKLLLAHQKGGKMFQETLNPHQRQRSYLCGRLLAVLGEAQRRASGAPLNRTLLDRFYGSVSTAPGVFLPMLIKRTITDHLPKVRRENRGYAQLNNLIQELATGIDDGGGFPRTLSLFEQGAFVLGFYQQRAALSFRPEQQNADSSSKEEVHIDAH